MIVEFRNDYRRHWRTKLVTFAKSINSHVICLFDELHRIQFGSTENDISPGGLLNIVDDIMRNPYVLTIALSNTSQSLAQLGPQEVGIALTRAQRFGGTSIEIKPVVTRKDLRKCFIHWITVFANRFAIASARKNLKDFGPVFQRMRKLTANYGTAALFVLPSMWFGLITPIWCVHKNNTWYWTPYEDAIGELGDLVPKLGSASSKWMNVSTMIVRDGFYKGERPAHANIIVLQALHNHNPLPSPEQCSTSELIPNQIRAATGVVDSFIINNFPFDRKVTLAELDCWVSTNHRLTSIHNFKEYFSHPDIWKHDLNEFLGNARQRA